MEKTLRHRRSTKRLTLFYPLCFIAPYFIFYGIFNLYPILYTFSLSFTKWNGVGDKVFVGLENYIRLFTTDKYFLSSIGNTLLLAIGYAPIQLVVAMITAVIISSSLARFKNLHQTAVFLPYVTMSVAIGLIFSQLFAQKNGSINIMLTEFGLIDKNIPWLRLVPTARIVTMIMIYWKYLGYICILFLAGIANIPGDFYEAAEIDGANGRQKFFRITLPLLKPILLFVMVTAVSGCLQVFDEPFMLFSGAFAEGTGVGGPSYSVFTTVWYMYDSAFGRFMQYGYASSISYALFAIIAFISIIGYRFFTRKDDKLA